MVETFCDLADRRMEAAVDGLGEMRPSVRLRALIALRLEQNRPDKEAIRRALAVLALPQHARAAAQITARTVDAIWRAAGDQASGFNWYSKRASLAVIYTSMLLYWLRDTSEDDAPTLGFLDRRLAGVIRVGRLRRRVEGALHRLPALPRLRMGDTG